MTDRDDLLTLRKTELAALARAYGIPGRSKMNKTELVEAIIDHRLTLTGPEMDSRSAGTGPATGPDDGEVSFRSKGGAGQRRSRRGPGGRDADAPRIDATGADNAQAAPPGWDALFQFLDSTQSTARRTALRERHRAFFDFDRPCRWRSIEGHVCRLPSTVESANCALHGGLDIVDLALPVAGHLGFDTWPELVRHLALATYDVDPIGLDPVVAEMVWHLVNFLYFDYFRVEVTGVEHIPATGGAIVVANHGGGALPYDAFMLTSAIANEAAVPRRLRVIGTEVFDMLPWVSHMYRKSGGAYASRADADYLLSNERLLGVFPEGERGFMKPVWEAYEVQRFGRGGFVEMAEHHGVPIVPAAIVGAEETHPVVGVSETLAKLVRMVLPQQRVDKMAVVLNPIPLPVQFHIRFLPPVTPAGIETAADPLAVLERTEQIQQSIQTALDGMLRDRRSPFS